MILIEQQGSRAWHRICFLQNDLSLQVLARYKQPIISISVLASRIELEQEASLLTQNILGQRET